MATTKLTKVVIDKLLHKLGHDDKFREEFRRDPRAAVQSLGAPADLEELNSHMCYLPLELASKESLRESREFLRGFLSGCAFSGMEVGDVLRDPPKP